MSKERRKWVVRGRDMWDKAWVNYTSDMWAFMNEKEIRRGGQLHPETPLVTEARWTRGHITPGYYASLSSGWVPWIGPFDTMEEAKQVAEGLCIGHPLFAYVKERNPL